MDKRNLPHFADMRNGNLIAQRPTLAMRVIRLGGYVAVAGLARILFLMISGQS